MEAVDVLIVGGGVLGTAIAARLSRTTAKACLVEEQDDLAEGASKGNAGIATSFYGTAGSLQARLIGASNPRWEDLCRRLDVPYRRIGAVMAAVGPEEATRLPVLQREIAAHGARAELITAEEARRMEPLLTPECTGAISLPDEGIIDPMRLTIGYAELAAGNGVKIERSRPVNGFRLEGNRITHAETPRGPIEARYVINAAGLSAGALSALAGGEQLGMWPRQGQYWILDRAFGASMRQLVFPIPMEHTRGAQVVPTTNGSVLLGPSAEDTDRWCDKSTDESTLQQLLQQTRRLVPSVSPDYVIKTYAAIRPATPETFHARFDRQVSNLLHVGSRSAGVSMSPALADYVVDLLQQDGLDATDRRGASTEVPAVPRFLLDPNPERLASLDRRYNQIVCACEQVTAAEIAASLRSAVPATSIEGVRKRTRATGGRCQGSVCMVGVAFLISLHSNVPPERIRFGRDGGVLGKSDAV